MHGRKGFVLVITLVISSLILTMSLYLLASAAKENERVSLKNKMLDYSGIRDREYLLTEAYNKITENGENLDIVNNYLKSSFEIIKEDCGGVYYDAVNDLIYTETSFNDESLIISYYSYFNDSGDVSFTLLYTKFKNRY